MDLTSGSLLHLRPLLPMLCWMCVSVLVCSKCSYTWQYPSQALQYKTKQGSCKGENEDYYAHEHEKKKRGNQRDGNEHFANIEPFGIEQGDQELMALYVQKHLDEQAMLELQVFPGPKNENGKTMGSTKLNKMEREEDEKVGDNTELVKEGHKSYFYSHPRKKSKTRKKHHLANISGLEHRKRHETITASQENFDIRVTETADSGQIGTDFHVFLPSIEESKKRGRVKHKWKSEEYFESYGDGKLVNSSVKFDECGEAAMFAGDIDNMTKYQKEQMKRTRDAGHDRPFVERDGTARSHKQMKKKKKKDRSNDLTGENVSQTEILSNITIVKSNLSADAHDSEMVQREKVQSGTDETSKETEHKKKKNKKRKHTDLRVSLDGLSCDRKRTKEEAPEICCPTDFCALKVVRDNEAKQERNSGIHEVDEILPCRRKRKFENDSTINDSTGDNLNNNLKWKSQKLCTEEVKQKISELADVKKQDIKIVVSKKRKLKKSKRKTCNKAARMTNNYELSFGQMISNQEDLSCSPKRRKKAKRSGTNNPSSYVQQELDGTLKNQDIGEVDRNATQENEKRAHVKQAWCGETNDLDSDNDPDEFTFPNIHGTDVSSSSESDIEGCLKSSLKQTIMSMEEMPGSCKPVDAAKTGQEHLAKCGARNHRCPEHETETSLSFTANTSCVSDSCQAKDSVSKGADFRKDKKNGLDPELRYLWNLKPADIEQLKRAGINFETGVWTKDETEILQRNMIDFCDTTGMSLENLKDLISDRSTASRKTKKQLGIYYMLANGLNRKMKDVHRKLMRSAHPSHSLGAWTVQEEKLFSELYQKYGSQWSKIGREMGRSQDSVRYQMIRIQRGKVRKGLQNVTENRTLGQWKRDEKERLLKAVDELSPKIEGRGGEENEKEMPIYWKAVAVRVKTRNAEQCRVKWAYDLSWKSRDRKLKNGQMKILLNF